MTRFRGRNVLVVGVTSGIGRACAERLADEGARIVAVGRDRGRLEEATAGFSGEGHLCHVADAALPDQLKTLRGLGKEIGGFDGAVVAAGGMDFRPLSLTGPDELASAYTTNVATAINITNAVAKAAKPEGASIVWLSSAAAKRGSPGFLAYAAAKGALLSAVRVVAGELASRRIRVNAIVAGIVDTPLSRGWMAKLTEQQRDAIAADYPLGPGHPSDIAGAVLFLLSPDARWITGTELAVDGGYLAG